MPYGQAASCPRTSWCGVMIVCHAVKKSCIARCSAVTFANRSCAARSACDHAKTTGDHLRMGHHQDRCERQSGGKPDAEVCNSLIC